MNRSFYQFNEVIDLSSVLLYPQGRNLRGGMGGNDSPPPPNSRFRRAQRKFAGQNYCLSKAVQGTQRDSLSFDVGKFGCCPKIF